MGEGYSQFYDEGTRHAILRKVKQLYAANVGVGSQSLEEDPEIKLDILKESLNLLVQSVKQERIERREKEAAEARAKGTTSASQTPRREELSSSTTKPGFSSRK